MNVLATLLVLAAASQATDVVDGFVPRTFGSMPYRLFVPHEKLRQQALPLIVHLHGTGGAGTDNEKQLSGGNKPGTYLWTTPTMQARHPAYVLVPQLPHDTPWGDADSDGLTPSASRLLELIANLQKEFAIDADRVYLMGVSLGGGGTWDLISKRPDFFAAAVPLCGYGNSSRVLAARNVPIWAFHGARDKAVPVSHSQSLVTALRSAGSAVRYTEYPDVGHDVWTRAFAEQELPDWLFAQKNKR